MRRDIVRIYNLEILEIQKNNEKPSSKAAPEIPFDVLETFKKRLLGYDYEFLRHKNDIEEFIYVKTKSWALRVMIRKNEIRFTAPASRSFNSNLMFDTLQTASELCDHGKLVIFDTYLGDWTNPA